MITSIFSKSKPINFLIVFFISLLAFFVAILRFDETELTASYIVKLNLVFLSCYFSILLTDFIVSKNYLSQKSNYEVFFFSLFLLLFPKVFLHVDIVLANLFVLLALRRLLSLRSQKELIKKLYDAAFFIGIATLFYFWAILFFAIIFVTLFFHSKNKIEHWFIPLLGLVTVAIIAMACSVIFNNDFFSILNIAPQVSFDFSLYNSVQFIVATTLLFSFGIWSSVYYLKAIKKKKTVLRSTYKIVFTTCFIAIIIMLLSPIKDGSEFLFLFAPLAIIITNYAEMIKEKWFKEVFILLMVITPFILLML
jgi:hypothetical protein